MSSSDVKVPRTETDGGSSDNARGTLLVTADDGSRSMEKGSGKGGRGSRGGGGAEVLLSSFIDGLGFGWYQILVVACVMIMYMADGAGE